MTCDESFVHRVAITDQHVFTFESPKYDSGFRLIGRPLDGSACSQDSKISIPLEQQADFLEAVDGLIWLSFSEEDARTISCHRIVSGAMEKVGSAGLDKYGKVRAYSVFEEHFYALAVNEEDSCVNILKTSSLGEISVVDTISIPNLGRAFRCALDARSLTWALAREHMLDSKNSPEDSIVVSTSDRGTYSELDIAGAHFKDEIESDEIINHTIDSIAICENRLVAKLGFLMNSSFHSRSSNYGSAVVAVDIVTKKVLELDRSVEHQIDTDTTFDNEVVEEVLISPSGDYVLLVKKSQFCRIVASGSGETVAEIGSHRAHLAYSWSADSKTIVGDSYSVSPGGSQRASSRRLGIWSVEDCDKQVSELSRVAGYRLDAPAWSLAVVNDSILVGTNLGDLVELDGESLAPSKTLKIHEAGITCISLSPDGKTIATASEDAKVTVRNAFSHELILEWLGPLYNYCLTWHSSGKMLLVGEGDLGGALRLASKSDWDEHSVRKILNSPDDDNLLYRAFEYSCNLERQIYSERLAACVRMLVVAEQGLGSIKTFVGSRGSISEVGWYSEEGRYLVVSCSRAGRLRIWDPISGETIRSLNIGPISIAAGLCVGDRVLLGRSDGLVQWIDLKDFTIGAEYRGHKSGIRSVAYCEKTKTVVSGGTDGRICVWAEDGMLRGYVQAHDTAVFGLCVDSTKNQIVSCGFDRMVQSWKLP